MKKIFLTLFFIILSTNLYASNIKKVYFAGGCFWCMEESFDKVKGVIETISGYSGGHVKNPKYKDVVKNTTGHYETLEITYDSTITNFEKLLEITSDLKAKDNAGKSVYDYVREKGSEVATELLRRATLSRWPDFRREQISDCAICLDQLRVGDKVVMISCGHHFHINCLVRWTRPTCPLCRADW